MAPLLSVPGPAASLPPPRLLDQLGDALRSRGYVASIRQAYLDWARRSSCSTANATRRRWDQPRWPPSSSSWPGKNQARRLPWPRPGCRLLFLYDVVLGRPLGTLPTSVGATGGTLAEAPRLLDQIRHVLRVRHYAAPNRGLLRRLGAAFHPLPRQTASGRSAHTARRGFSDPSGRAGACLGQHAEPGPVRSRGEKGTRLCLAVQRCRSSVGASPTRQRSLQPVAIGAAMEVTTSPEPSMQRTAWRSREQAGRNMRER